MKIISSRFQQINKSYSKNKLTRLEGKDAVKSDKVNLSREAQEMKRIREVLAQTPETRVEKINQLKKAIQQGTYEVNGEKVAEKMIERHYLDRVIG